MAKIAILYTQDTIPDISWNPGDDLVRAGQRYMLESMLGSENVNLQVVNRNKLGAWFRNAPPFTITTHPKLIYPYWWLRPIDRECPPADCDYLINASGPLLYYGNRCHTCTEPWYGMLSRVLTGSGPRPHFLNMAFGTCVLPPYKWHGLAHRLLAGAAETLARHAAFTTCRETHAADLLKSRGILAPVVACPSLLGRHKYKVERATASKGYIAVNLHPRGTRGLHKGLDAEESWLTTCRDLLRGLARFGRPIRLVFHETLETQLAERYFPDWMEGATQPRTIPDFLNTYGEADFAVTSRIHGAYAAASMGVNSVSITSDSRGAMIDVLGLPSVDVGAATAEELLALTAKGLECRDRERERLIAICEKTEAEYRRLLTEAFEKHPPRAR